MEAPRSNCMVIRTSTGDGYGQLLNGADETVARLTPLQTETSVINSYGVSSETRPMRDVTNAMWRPISPNTALVLAIPLRTLCMSPGTHVVARRTFDGALLPDLAGKTENLRGERNGERNALSEKILVEHENAWRCFMGGDGLNPIWLSRTTGNSMSFHFGAGTYTDPNALTGNEASRPPSLLPRELYRPFERREGRIHGIEAARGDSGDDDELVTTNRPRKELPTASGKVPEVDGEWLAAVLSNLSTEHVAHLILRHAACEAQLYLSPQDKDTERLDSTLTSGLDARSLLGFVARIANIQAQKNFSGLQKLLGRDPNGRVLGKPWAGIEDGALGLDDDELCSPECFWDLRNRVPEKVRGHWSGEETRLLRKLGPANAARRRGACAIARTGAIRRSCVEIFVRLLRIAPPGGAVYGSSCGRSVETGSESTSLEPFKTGPGRPCCAHHQQDQEEANDEYGVPIRAGAQRTGYVATKHELVGLVLGLRRGTATSDKVVDSRVDKTGKRKRAADVFDVHRRKWRAIMSVTAAPSRSFATAKVVTNVDETYDDEVKVQT